MNRRRFSFGSGAKSRSVRISGADYTRCPAAAPPHRGLARASSSNPNEVEYYAGLLDDVEEMVRKIDTVDEYSNE